MSTEGEPDESATLSLPEETLDVEWVRRGELYPNSWNPNQMHSQKQEELVQSILTHGWTAPLVVDPDGRIIDGEQRWAASADTRIRSNEQLVPDDVEPGYVPVYRLDRDEDEQVVATLQHNLSGEHAEEQVGSIIEDLERAGLRDETEDMLNLEPRKADSLIDAAQPDTTNEETDEAEADADNEEDDEEESQPIDRDSVLMQRFTVEVSHTEAALLRRVLGPEMSSDALLEVVSDE